MAKKEKLYGFTDEEFKEKVHPFNQEVVSSFIDQQHLSDQTLRQYRSAINIFFKFVYEKCMNKPIYELKKRDALAFQNFLVNAGLSSSAIRMKRSVVSSLCNHIELYYEEHTEFRNIFAKGIPSVATSYRREKTIITLEELEELKNELTKRKDWQKLAFLLVAFSSAGRRAELIQLKTDIFDAEESKDKNGNPQGYVMSKTLRGKGKGKEGKPIKLMISMEAVQAMKTWVNNRHVESEYIFASKDGKKSISLNTVNLWVDEIGDILGKKLKPHDLRKSRATSIVLGGKDIKFAQKLLNHNDSSTTDKHYIIRKEDDGMEDLFN